MKIKNGYLLKKVDNVNMVISVGNEIKNLNGMIILNDTSVFLWKLLEIGSTEVDLIGALLNEYQIDKESAAKSVKEFISKLKNLKILVD